MTRLLMLILLVSPAIPQLLMPRDGGGHGGGGHGGHGGGGHGGGGGYGGDHGGGGGGYSGGDHGGGGGGYGGGDHGGGGGGYGGGDHGGGGYGGGHGGGGHGGGGGGGYGGGDHGGGGYHPAPVCHPQTITKYKTVYKDRKAQVVNNVEVRNPKPHVKKVVETRYTTIRYPVFITQVIKPLLTQVETKVRPMFFTKTINRYTTVKFTVTGIGQVTVTTVKYEKEYITRCMKKGYGHRRQDGDYGLENRDIGLVDISPDSPTVETYKTQDPESVVTAPYDFSIGKYRESSASPTDEAIEPTSTKSFRGAGRPSFGPLRSLRPLRSSAARPYGPYSGPRDVSPARSPELLGSHPETPEDLTLPHPRWQEPPRSFMVKSTNFKIFESWFPLIRHFPFPSRFVMVV
ncbi:uncharacterized protein [Macrobrachium rosenbergii]|uniref:uncharacterized protein n=1 Tax=Macrobrachium rosenbergii TaxID=79674 RepID=UPI0034D405C7